MNVKNWTLERICADLTDEDIASMTQKQQADLCHKAGYAIQEHSRLGRIIDDLQRIRDLTIPAAVRQAEYSLAKLREMEGGSSE
jgi:hypothetical protein